MRTRTHRLPGLVVGEHELEVPLDHDAPDRGTVEVFARSLVAVDKERDDLPWLVFLQGGPGYEAPRPERRQADGWLDRALADYRVLLLDQRGMGRSTPIGPDAAAVGAEALAERLALHRADSIVRDAECFRAALDVDRWSVLGQSFGGFCVVAYLSAFPGSLREAFVAGGLPPLDRHIDDVYRATYRTTREKVHRYYERYPEDRERVRDLMALAADGALRLPGGDVLTPGRVRQLGLSLGMGAGAERLHHLLELPPRSPAFLHDVERASPFARNPLYAVVHESCYAPGIVTGWSAERLLPAEYAEDPTLLTGEHVYPWMFDEIAGLVPFRETAHVLAARQWGPLYDPDILAANEVPAAAAVYVDDMYVPRELSLETAARIRGLRPWVTNEFEHDGISAGGARVLDRLIALARGEA